MTTKSAALGFDTFEQSLKKRIDRSMWLQDDAATADLTEFRNPMGSQGPRRELVENQAAGDEGDAVARQNALNVQAQIIRDDHAVELVQRTAGSL